MDLVKECSLAKTTPLLMRNSAPSSRRVTWLRLVGWWEKYFMFLLLANSSSFLCCQHFNPIKDAKHTYVESFWLWLRTAFSRRSGIVFALQMPLNSRFTRNNIDFKLKNENQLRTSKTFKCAKKIVSFSNTIFKLYKFHKAAAKLSKNYDFLQSHDIPTIFMF